MGQIFISAGGSSEASKPNTWEAMPGVSEATEMIRIRDLLVSELRSRAYDILAVPDDLDAEQTWEWINARCQIEDVAIEICVGNASDTGIRGATAYYIALNETRKSHAESLLLALLRRVPQLPSHGAQPDVKAAKEVRGFCRQVSCPALVIEVASLSNPQDFSLLQNRIRDFALGIADGLVVWIRTITQDYQAESVDTAMVFPSIRIRVNLDEQEETGILVNSNAYIPIELAKRVGAYPKSESSIPQATQNDTVYLQAIDLESPTVSLGWEAAARTLTLDIQPSTPHSVSVHYQPQRSQCFTEPAINLDLMLIPGGTFTMGSPKNELGRYNDEEPQHEVTVSTFLMGRYPITQAQWRAVATMREQNQELDPAPSKFKGDDRPVEQVSWHDAVEFCARLSEHTGHTYRLPTEAEWEYACRANTDTPFHFGESITTDLANYQGEDDENDPEKYPGNYGNGPKGVYRRKTTPVNHFHPLANTFGLCDMHGNVWEWCQDHWHENYEEAPNDGSAWVTEDADARRVIRGGSWYDFPRLCRSACRDNLNPGGRDYNFGFRVVCEARGLDASRSS
ncbi:MAG: SUMF1/EgtB/PvdO family nonheme iron enzyme [Cyanobacteria bacterium P01_F01_bin.86]